MKKTMAVILAMGILCTSSVTALCASSTEVVSKASDKVYTNADSLDSIVSIESFDGYAFDGRLRLPEGEEIDKVVVFVNGSGPNTYDNHRNTGDVEFNYFDLFAEQLNSRGIAFFSYNTRGVTPGEEPPLYAQIDVEEYQKYIPSNEVRDVECIIRELNEIDRLKDAEVYLLGWSAGTIIAPLVAKNGNVQVDALLLAGYCNDKMEDVLMWQQTGGSSMVFYKQYYDYDGNGKISKEEFEEDQFGLKDYIGATFEQIDVNQDGVIDEADSSEMLKRGRKAIFDAIERRDDQWLKDNYGVYLTSAWFWDYRNTPANRDTLPQLDMPIHIFHGTYDENVSVQGVYDIQDKFEALGKDNLQIHVFDDNDHDLNYVMYVLTGEVPDGIAEIFEVCENL